MSFFFKSILTTSFWRYALLSVGAAGRILATIGVLFLFMEVLDFCKRELWAAYYAA